MRGGGRCVRLSLRRKTCASSNAIINFRNRTERSTENKAETHRLVARMSLQRHSMSSVRSNTVARPIQTAALVDLRKMKQRSCHNRNTKENEPMAARSAPLKVNGASCFISERRGGANANAEGATASKVGVGEGHTTAPTRKRS